MAMVDTSRGPAHAMAGLMAREIEREARRLGTAYDRLEERISLGTPGPGILVFREPHGLTTEMSFAVGMRALAALPAHAGSRAVRSALGKAAAERGSSPYPQNDPAWLQVGDRLGPGRVDGITVGRDYDSAKNGNPVRAVSRRDLSDPGYAGRTIVTASDAREGWWRRASHVVGLLPKPAPAGREALRRLRRDDALLRDAYWEERRRVLQDRGDPERLLAYSGMLTASRRMLEVLSAVSADPDKAERTHLRARRRDLNELGRALRNPREPSVVRDGPLDRALALAGAELREVDARRAELRDAIKAARPARAPAP